TLSGTYTPIRDDLGDIFAFIASYHDLTEEIAARERTEAEVIARTMELAQRNEALQQAKEALEMSSARLEVLLEQLPSGVMLISAEDSSVSIINRRAVEILQSIGVALEPTDDPDEAARNAIGRNAETLLRDLNVHGVSGAFIPYEERPLYRALRCGEANEAEQHIPMANGQILYLLTSAAALHAADGKITSAIVVLNDITAVKQLERSREDFFTTMAHE